MTGIQARFQTPKAGRLSVLRRRLLRQLQESAPRRLTTIIAPAGYGKTSLAVQWKTALKDDGVATAWVSLDADDGDQSHFLLTLLEALHHVSPSDSGGHDANGMSVASLLSVLSTRLRRMTGPLVLFLDDYHLAQNDAVEALVAKLLAANDLAHLKLVLTSRSAPRFPTSVLRLDGELQQIMVDDLSFSDSEAQEFFAGSGIKLERERISALNLRTEGWAVALQMVRMLVSDHREGDAVLATFDGNNQEMGRYLSEQVFSSLPQDVRGFLLKTAALPAVSRELAVAVSEDHVAAAVFSKLDAHALPISLLDGQGIWIRYHPVFNSFLNEQAQRSGIDRRDVLRKAARWFEQAGDCESAMRHALLAGDPALAAQIIENVGGWRLVYTSRRGGATLFRGLIAHASEIRLAAFPLTTLGFVIASAKSGQVEAASHYLSIVERSSAARDGDLARDLRVVRVLLSLYMDRRIDASELSALENDLSHDADMELVRRALVLNMLCYSFLGRTDLHRALTYGRLAMRCFRDGGADFGAIHLYTHIGQVAFFSGDVADASEAYASLIEEAQTNIGKGSDLDAVGQVLLGEVQSMRGEFDSAAASLSWALPHVERHDSWFDVLAAGFMARQRILRIGGDLLGAHAAMDIAGAAAKRRGFDRLVRLIDGERIALLLAADALEDARRFANVDGYGEATISVGPANDFATHLRGTLPAMIWTRLLLAEGSVARSRQIFDALNARQSIKPHVPRQIELALLDIRLMLAESREPEAARRLSEIMFSYPLSDYRALVLVEGATFVANLEALATTKHVAAIVLPRLKALLDVPRQSIAIGATGLTGHGETGRLTDREQSVIELLCVGLSNKEIGRKLQLSDNTVKFHLRNIYAKFNVGTRTGAVAAAREIGVLP